MSEPFADFASASRAVLEYLQAHVPLALWMVTRTDGTHWVVLNAADRGYGVKVGDMLPYAESLCAQRLECNAPSIAPDVEAVPAYRDAPARRRGPIGAYISYPLRREDGGLFGTLCAVHPQAQGADLLVHETLLALFARQLATILHYDLAREDAWRRAVRSEAMANTDALTGVLNRRGWDWICEREEQRSRDLGALLAVIVFDLDDLKRANDGSGHAAGDALLRTTAATLRAALRDDAALARTGGDEFAVLLPGASLREAEGVMQRLRALLDEAGIRISGGVAVRKPYRGLAEAWRRADEAMYADKQARRAARA
jgi:diguanylate cyclase (GGDEF)-like protein